MSGYMYFPSLTAEEVNFWPTKPFRSKEDVVMHRIREVLFFKKEFKCFIDISIEQEVEVPIGINFFTSAHYGAVIHPPVLYFSHYLICLIYARDNQQFCLLI